MNKKLNLNKLILSLLLDGVGMLSYLVPVLGEGFDVLWAPIAAWLLMKMYPGKVGKIAGTIEFLEEILPGVADYIPTFTLTFLYDYFSGEEGTEDKIPSGDRKKIP